MPPVNEVRECRLGGHVGIDSLADQLVNKSIEKGFIYNILCVGETGVGKSTLIDTLFNRHFDLPPVESHNHPRVTLKTESFELTEANVHLFLSITETVGFGDQINQDESYKPIINYIDEQFEAYIKEELKIKRNLQAVRDTRPHVCLYFISPSGHSIKALDILTMRALEKKVNIIPVIAKADTVTKSELQKFKANVLQELAHEEINLYQFPTDDEDVAETNAQMNALMPFAVIGSMDEIKVGNKNVRGRQYPWGSVQVENENHCDFVKIREMILRINMQDLVETTHLTHYERYRKAKLEQMGFSDSQTISLQEAYQQKRNDLLTEYQRNEHELKNSFMIRVKEKEAELKEQEKQLHHKFDQIKAKHTSEKKSLEDERNKLQEEIFNLEQRKEMTRNQAAQHQSSSTLKGKKK